MDNIKFKLGVTVTYAFLCMCLFAYPTSLSAQDRVFTVKDSDYSVDFTFDTENGLPSNGVNDIIQDQTGYLWAATFNGLVRYDGVNFTVFNTNNLPGLDYNRFTSVAEDMEGNIWGGLEYGSLIKISKDTSHVFEIGHEISSVINVLDFVQTGLNSYWVGTSEGLFFFDGVHFEYREDLPKNIVQQLFFQDDQLYVLFYDQLYQLSADGTEKKRMLHIENGVLENESGYTITEGIEDHFLSSVLIGDNQKIISSHGYVLRISENSHEFLLKREDLQLATIYGVMEDRGEYYLFGTDGVYRISNFDNVDISITKVTDRRVNSAFFDSENTMWLATIASGLLQLNDTPVYQGDRFDVLENTAVTAITESGNNKLLVGTNCDGLHVFSNEGHDVFDPDSGIENYCIWSVEESEDGTIWAGAWGGGVFYKPPGDGHFQPFKSQQGLDDAAILSIYEDYEGSVWFGTHQSGVYKFNGETTESVKINTDDRVPAIRMIYHDSDDSLLFATDSGIGVYEKGEIMMLDQFNLLSTKNFRVIKKDADGRYWFGSYGGGLLIRDTDGTFLTLTTENGLLDNTVSQIEFDEAGNVWLAGNLGIFFIDKQEMNLLFSDRTHDLKIARLGVNEGLPTRETTGGFMPSSLLNSQGKLFVPMVQGLAMIDTEKMVLNRELPGVVLEEVEINGVRSSIDDLTTISYGAQRIIFSFSVLSFKNPEYVRVKYMLEGLDSEWRQLDNSREIEYTSLPAGDYVIKIKASNNHGIWNEEVAFAGFSVSPPFWQAAWFITLMVLLLSFGIFVVINIRIKSIRKQNQILQKRVDERTEELSNSNTELKKLIEEKNKLHSILAHDLRSPFSSIIGYVDLLRQTFKDEGDEENHQMMELLLDSSKNTLSLLDNLLQWSGTKGKGLDPNIEPTDINLLVEEALKMTETQARFKEIDVLFIPGAPKYVHADRNMILTVVRNLVSNALKFSGNNTSVHVRTEDQEDNVLVSINDEGVGMAEDECMTLFEGNNAYKKLGTQGEKGIGMGLQVCKEFLEIHGQKIWADSRPGEGSTFYFTLQKVSDD